MEGGERVRREKEYSRNHRGKLFEGLGIPLYSHEMRGITSLARSLPHECFVCLRKHSAGAGTCIKLGYGFRIYTFYKYVYIRVYINTYFISIYIYISYIYNYIRKHRITGNIYTFKKIRILIFPYFLQSAGDLKVY